MDHELLAEGLGWAEGPTVLPDGRICFVESYRSQVSVWERGRGVSRYAYTAGGAQLLRAGRGRARCTSARTAARSGPWRAEEMSVAVDPAHRARGRAGGDHRDRARRQALQRPQRPRLRAGRPALLHRPGHVPAGRPASRRTCSCWRPTARGRLLAELDAADVPQRHRHRGRRQRRLGGVVHGHGPSPATRHGRHRGHRAPARRQAGRGRHGGGADGRLYVTTVNGGGIDVIAPDGTYDRSHQGRRRSPPTASSTGRDLIMTDAGVLADTADASYGGQLWRLPIDTEGLPHLVRAHRLSGEGRGSHAVPVAHRGHLAARRRPRGEGAAHRRGGRRAPGSSPRRASSSASGASPGSGPTGASGRRPTRRPSTRRSRRCRCGRTSMSRSSRWPTIPTTRRGQAR